MTASFRYRPSPILRLLIVIIVLLFTSCFSTGQEKKKIEILRSGYGESVPGMDANTQRLVDSVYIRHKEVLMWCDTAYIYSGTNKVNAVGNVHIRQGDTLHLYAEYVFYNGDTDFARAWENVRLINKSTTIYTDTLDYDLKTRISYYDDFGKIVDSTTTLTSNIGRYHIDEDNIYFFDNVNGQNEDFTLHSDTVLYNTETGKIYVDGPTTIRDSVNTLYTEDGWYDSNTGEAELISNPVLYGETQQITADYIKYNEENGNGRALGNARLEDFENRSIVLGNTVIYNDVDETAMATDSAIYMTYTESDTLYLHADTLRTVPDTIEGEKVISAFYKVRFFRTDVQGVCDSLVYFTKDSVIQLYQEPVIWSEIHQLLADQISIKQVANGPDELHLFNHSFIISQQDSGQFDQIKGKEMVAYIVNRELDNILVDGNGETLYYAREEDDIIGLNRAESSNISIYFKEGKIFKIAFQKQPVGELKPILGLSEKEKYLDDFDWKEELRPKSKDDIFPRILTDSEPGKIETRDVLQE